MQGEKEEALSKRWEIEIHISYSGVSANADPERFICLNLCFIWIGDVFWDFQFQWLYPTFPIKKKLCDGWFNRWVRKHVVIPPLPCLSTHADCLDDRICLTIKLCRI